MFLPAYLIVVAVAPSFRRIARNASLRTVVDGVTAAATGAIAGAVFVLGRRAITDGATLAIFLVALVVVLRVRKLPEPLLLLAAAVIGIAIHGAPR